MQASTKKQLSQLSAQLTKAATDVSYLKVSDTAEYVLDKPSIMSKITEINSALVQTMGSDYSQRENLAQIFRAVSSTSDKLLKLSSVSLFTKPYRYLAVRELNQVSKKLSRIIARV